jgi:signal transduction histidine kinase/CheY-like chemotaxis protein
MKRGNGSKRIYEKEFRFLDKIDKIISNQSLSKQELLKEYIHLGKEFEKLLKNTIKITLIGDATQLKLMHSLELEKEKLQLEQIVKDRVKEIEEKNRQLEEQTGLLKEKSEKLKEMSEIKSRFFANVSHEFRTPLTLIIGPLEQLLSQCSSKDEEKNLTLMLRNSQRLLGLVNQLLELSEFESKKIKLRAHRQNIIPFLKGITASFESLANQNELDLTFYAEQDTALFFDPAKLEEVIYNLLLNAIKFTPPGGKITVTAARSHKEGANFPFGALDISIADTGVGIPASRIEHVFDRFYQVKSSQGTQHKGSGLGLTIVRELVELHRGEIHARSREGENSGTEFIVRLPLGKAHLNPDEIVDLSEIPYSRKSYPEIRELYMAEKEEKESSYGIESVKKRTVKESEASSEEQEKNIILVVEDSVNVRDYIRDALEPHYKVLEAANGREGIDTAKKIIPDLIITDIIMPEKDGYELCHVLKNDIKTSHIPIIMLTVKATDENMLEGLETGADDYITKPFNTKILCARIKNLIDIRTQLQQNMKREMTLQPVQMSVSKIDREFFKDLQAVINKNMSDPDFNVEELCRKLYMGRTSLYRKIHALSGETPADFIRSCRLKKGAELLKQKSGTVLEVSFAVGFSSSSYFAKCFKEKFHQLPSEYQE